MRGFIRSFEVVIQVGGFTEAIAAGNTGDQDFSLMDTVRIGAGTVNRRDYRLERYQRGARFPGR